MGGWVVTMLVAAVRVAPADPVGLSGANVAEQCQFPGVVAFRGGEVACSGTMVHPRVMITSAHCLEGGAPGRVRFGESYAPFEHRIDVERCEANPEYAASGAAADDLAYCILLHPVDELPPVPVLAGCETEHVVPGTIAVLVGFGVTDDGGGFGRKRYAFSTVSGELSGHGTVSIGDAGASGCDGDSGGPALVQLPDGTWRVIGVLSRSPPCGDGPSTYRVIADQVAWVETQSGFDITPCFDEAGQWQASPECAAFDADPRVADEGWDHYCDGERLTPTPTCEPQQSETSSSSAGDASSSSSSSSGIDGSDTSTSAPSEDAGSEGCGCATTGDPRLAFLWVLCGCAAGYSARTCRRTRDRWQ